MVVKWWCSRCRKITLSLDSCRPLPREPEQKGRNRREVNVRMVTGAVHTGLGHAQVQMLTSILDAPAPKKSWTESAAAVYPAMEAGGRASAKQALVKERVAALAAGIGPDEKGETPIEHMLSLLTRMASGTFSNFTLPIAS